MKLYFVILIPQLEPGIYNRILLETLPINGKNLKLPSATALVDRNATYFIHGECRSIEDHNICNRKQLSDASNDDCFSRILRGYSGKCIFTEPTAIKEIKQLTENHIIIKNASPTKMTTDCKLSDRTLKGTYLISFTNCSVTLDNKTFTNREIHIKPRHNIIPLVGIYINQSDFEVPEITIEKLHQLHIHNRHQLSELKQTSVHHTYTSVGLSSISIFSVIAVAVYFVAKGYFNTQETEKAPRKTSSTEATIDSGRIDLEGGVVTEESTQRPLGNRGIFWIQSSSNK